MDVKAIQLLVQKGKYSVKSHAVRHMLEEGFDEQQCIEALLDGKEIEVYPDECRCLILGHFHFTPKSLSPLHIVCDYSDPTEIDIVTAYIPQKPEWETPWKRGRKKR